MKKDYFNQLIINDTTSIINTTTNTITLSQEESSITLWSPYTSIVITSQFLPVARSQIFSPTIYYSNSNIEAPNNSTTQNILLEYSPDINIYNRQLVYNPTAQYRIFSLTNNNPLYNLDFKFYYRTVLGNLEEVILNSGSSVSVKMGFFKKSKFNNLKNLN